jgi:nucleoside-diphosphate-sugar epimerase
MRLLVTGATGFVGGHLARRLIADGDEVHVIVRRGSSANRIPEAAAAHVYDGTCESLVGALSVARPDLVFHVAGLFVDQHKPEQVDDLIHSNVLFTTQLAEAMIAVEARRLVNVGTSWEHFEDSDYDPVNLYAASKRAAQIMLRWYTEARDLKVSTLKLFDTYGPHDRREKIWTRLARMAREPRRLSMSSGRQLIDLVHVDDVVGALKAAGSALINGEEPAPEGYAVSSGRTRPLREIVAIFERLAGKPFDIDWGGRPYRPREVMSTWTRGAPPPGWLPKVNLEDGVRALLAEYV